MLDKDQIKETMCRNLKSHISDTKETLAMERVE